MNIITLEGSDVSYLAELFTLAAKNGDSVRVAIDGGFKVSRAQGIWTYGFGKSNQVIEAKEV